MRRDNARTVGRGTSDGDDNNNGNNRPRFLFVYLFIFLIFFSVPISPGSLLVAAAHRHVAWPRRRVSSRSAGRGVRFRGAGGSGERVGRRAVQYGCGRGGPITEGRPFFRHDRLCASIPRSPAQPRSGSVVIVVVVRGPVPP